MTHKTEILDFLAAADGDAFDDDELAEALGIHPRQTVNRMCRELAAQGVIDRFKVGKRKITNRLAVGDKRP